jgi:hypothetical protein
MLKRDGLKRSTIDDCFALDAVVDGKAEGIRDGFVRVERERAAPLRLLRKALNRNVVLLCTCMPFRAKLLFTARILRGSAPDGRCSARRRRR